MQPNIPTGILGKLQVCERIGLCERTLETMVKSGAFPPPVRLGKRVYWSITAVEKWHTALFAPQEAWSPLEARNPSCPTIAQRRP